MDNKGKITKYELHPSLLNLINNNNGGGYLKTLKNSVDLEHQTNSVEIGIDEYNKDTDTLMVYKNTVYLEEGISYSISEDSRSINSLEGDWKISNSKVIINFIVFKNTPNVDTLDFYTKSEINNKLIANTNENCIYVDATKSDSNSGISPEQAVKTMKKAFSILSQLGSKTSFGTWKIKVKGYGDTHTYDGCKCESLPYIQKLIIEGDVGSDGLPNTIFKKDTKDIGLWIEPGVRYLKVSNIHFKDFSNSFNGYGLLMKNQGYVFAYNCIAEGCDCGFAGINNVTIVTHRCIAKTCTVGYRAQYSSNATFGPGYGGELYDNNGNGCKAIGCTHGVLVTRNAVAHVDYMNIEDCTYAGVLVEMASRVHVVGSHFKRNDFGVRVEGTAEWINNTEEVNNFYMSDDTDKNRVIYGHFGSGRETRMYSQNATNEYRRSIKSDVVVKTGDARERIYEGSDIGLIPAYWFVTPAKRIRVLIRGKNEGTAKKVLSLYTCLKDSSGSATLASCNINNEGEFEVEFKIHPKTINSQIQLTKILYSFNNPALASSDRSNDMTQDRLLFLTAEMTSSTGADKLTIYNMETYFIG